MGTKVGSIRDALEYLPRWRSMGFLLVSCHICSHACSLGRFRMPQEVQYIWVPEQSPLSPCVFTKGCCLLRFILQAHPFSQQVLPCISCVSDQYIACVQCYTFCLLNRTKSSELHCFLRLMNSLRGVKITSVINLNCEDLMYLFFRSPPLLLDRISPHLIQSTDLIQPCLEQLAWIHYIDNINLCNSCIRILY